MMQHKEYYIPFLGLKQGKHKFKFDIANAFFESFGYTEFNSVDVEALVVLEKGSSMMELELLAKGSININCDLTNEPYDQAISGDLDLVVKFGEEFNNEDDEILILPHGEHQLNIAQYLYELVVLAVPSKRVHPGVLDGTLESKALERLAELQPKETKEDQNDTDPRWDALKDLLTDK